MTKRTQGARRTREDWQQHITRQQQSDISIAGYCREHKLTLSNFYYWRSKLANDQGHLSSLPASSSQDWLSLSDTLTPPVSLSKPMAITLTLPHSITLTIQPA